MRVSAFSLPLYLSLVFFGRSAEADTQSYLLDTSYSGSTFFNGWNFWTDTDPTHGFVQYLSQTDAQNAGLIKQGAGSPAYLGVDYNTTLSTSAQGRKSVRITTQKSWTHGLFIGDVAHMPDSTCGVWPAFWMFGPNWPSSGEIDIIEGVSRNTQNLMSLHSSANCVMTQGTQYGSTNSMQCDGSLNGNSGCSVNANSSAVNTYGTPFNSNGGGVYATEWTSNYIQTWFFPRGSVPSDITTGLSPNPSGWGTPTSSFQGGSSCNIDTHFANQNLVFDTTFCGDWAGGVWGGDSVCSGLASTCVDYVAGNPSAFSNAYWQVNSVKVYQLGLPATTLTSKTSVTITSSSTTSSSTTSTTITTASISSTKSSTSSTSTKNTSSTKVSSSTSKVVSTSKSSSSSVNTAAPTPTWTALGCYSDNVNGNRALNHGEAVPGGSTAMTVEGCQKACKSAGFVIAGLEYSQECWCGNSFINGGAYVGKDGTSGCTMSCKGKSTEWCGGGNRLSAWKWG